MIFYWSVLCVSRETLLQKALCVFYIRQVSLSLIASVTIHTMIFRFPEWRIFYEQVLNFKVSIIYVQVHFIICIREVNVVIYDGFQFFPSFSWCSVILLQKYRFISLSFLQFSLWNWQNCLFIYLLVSLENYCCSTNS